MLNVKLSSKYGRIQDLDSKIGNVRAVLKNGNPNKRYFTIVVDGEREYFTDLIEARFSVKQCPTDYREVTEQDLQAELSTRGTRIKGGKYVEVIEESSDYFVINFRGMKYSVPHSVGGAV